MLMTKNEIRNLIRESLIKEQNKDLPPNIKKIKDMLKRKPGDFSGEQILPDVFNKFRKEKINPNEKNDQKNAIKRVVTYILKNKITEDLIKKAHDEIMEKYPEIKNEIDKKSFISEDSNNSREFSEFYTKQKSQSKERFGNIGSLAAYGEDASDSGTGGIVADTGFTLAWELAAGPIGDIFGIGFGTHDAYKDHLQRNKINKYLKEKEETLKQPEKEQLESLSNDLFWSEVINIGVVVILTVAVVLAISTGGLLGFVAGTALGIFASGAGGLLKLAIRGFKVAKKGSTPVQGAYKAATSDSEQKDPDRIVGGAGGAKGIKKRLTQEPKQE